MRRLLLLTLLLGLTLASIRAHAAPTAAEHAAEVYAQQEIASHPAHSNLPDYTLPPDKLTQAVHLEKLSTTLHLTAGAWALLQLLLLLSLGIVAFLRDRARAVTRFGWLQTFAFLFALQLFRTLLNLPLSLYGHHISLAYGFSVQRWPSWFADLAKGFLLNWLLYSVLALILLWTIRRWPRRWWLTFSIVAVPLTFALVYAAPIAVDPIFNRFEPLALHHPELVGPLEHMGVPASHQFLMLASAKVTTPNAYVTGLGPSKRVVVWDTSLSKDGSVSPQVLWMIGHECGHYALGHVTEGTVVLAVFLPLLLWLCYAIVTGCLARFGSAWRIPSQSDLGVLAVVLLAVSVLSTLQEPIGNAISRHIEHEADIYGQEAIYGLVPDPRAAVRADMQDSGMRTLSDPNPPHWVELWLYNHPATGRRAAFGTAYDPWAPGMEPKYFPARH